MSPLVDGQGRIGGRINLVDALCLLFVAGLIPIAYSSWLLFHPARPRIDSIERTTVTATQEIAIGQPIRMMVKVRGDHFVPILRAYIGGVPALGFAFESPQSADIIIGQSVPEGTHDLVLYDGPTEVARAAGAISVGPSPGALIRVIGAFTLVDRESAERLKVGQTFAVAGRTPSQILALGEVTADRRELASPAGGIQTASPGTFEREAILRMQCDPHPDVASCHVSGVNIAKSAGAVIDVPGSSPRYRLRVHAIVPDQEPTRARLRLRVEGDAATLNSIRAGDRDIRAAAIDDRAAVVESVARPTSATAEVVVRVGLDRTSDGWRYHAHRLLPGESFAVVTNRYGVRGTIIQISTDAE